MQPVVMAIVTTVLCYYIEIAPYMFYLWKKRIYELHMFTGVFLIFVHL